MENKVFGSDNIWRIEIAEELYKVINFTLDIINEELNENPNNEQLKFRQLTLKLAKTAFKPIIEDGIGCLNFFTKYGQPLLSPVIVDGQEEQHQVISYFEGKDTEKPIHYFFHGALKDQSLLDQYNSLIKQDLSLI